MKLTGFARFMIVMIFAAPLAYIGASYYNGQDGIENIKKLLGLDKKENVEIVEPRPSDTGDMPAANPTPDNQGAPGAAEPAGDLKQENLRLREENIKLREQLQERDKEILELKYQLQQQKSGQSEN